MYRHTKEELNTIHHYKLQDQMELWQIEDETLRINEAVNGVKVSVDWHKNILHTMNTTLSKDSLKMLLNAFMKHTEQLNKIKADFNITNLLCDKLLLETKHLTKVTLNKIQNG